MRSRKWEKGSAGTDATRTDRIVSDGRLFTLLAQLALEQLHGLVDLGAVVELGHADFAQFLGCQLQQLSATDAGSDGEGGESTRMSVGVWETTAVYKLMHPLVLPEKAAAVLQLDVLEPGADLIHRPLRAELVIALRGG